MLTEYFWFIRKYENTKRAVYSEQFRLFAQILEVSVSRKYWYIPVDLYF